MRGAYPLTAHDYMNRMCGIFEWYEQCRRTAGPDTIAGNTIDRFLRSRERDVRSAVAPQHGL